MFLGQSQKDMKVYWHWKEDHLEVFGCIRQERLFEVANHLPRDQQSGQKLEQKNQFELFWGQKLKQKNRWAFWRPKAETEINLRFFEADSWSRNWLQLVWGQKKLKQESIWSFLRPIADTENNLSFLRQNFVMDNHLL